MLNFTLSENYVYTISFAISGIQIKFLAPPTPIPAILIIVPPLPHTFAFSKKKLPLQTKMLHFTILRVT